MACAAATAPSVYAGPSNRHAKTESNYRINLDGFGAPLPAVASSTPDLSIFATGQLNFKEIDSIPAVGPLVNGSTCAGWHSQPSMGGGGLFINEIRVRDNTDPGPVHIFAVDNMLRNGPQSQGALPIFAAGISAEPLGCQITSPGCQLSACQQEEATKTTFNINLPTCDPTSTGYASGDDCVVGRAAVPVFGDGLVEAVDDQTLQNLAQQEPAAVRGPGKIVPENFTPTAHLGRLR